MWRAGVLAQGLPDGPTVEQLGAALLESAPTQAGSGFQYASALEYARRYRGGSLTPSDVARAFLRELAASESARPPLRAFISVSEEGRRLHAHECSSAQPCRACAVLLRQAAASTERFRAKKPLSVLDGVLVAVKDEVREPR